MAVTEGSIPAASWIHPLAARAYYWDSYAIPLTRVDMSAEELALALARQAPRWVNVLMALRDGAVRLVGLRTVGPLGQSARRAGAPRIGEKFDAFTLWHLTPDELVTGEDDKHLDFRLSILKHGLPDHPRLTLSMTVTTHNRLGRAYLAAVLPFHKVIMRTFLARAARCGAV